MSHISGRAGWWKPPSPVLVGASGEQSPGATRQDPLRAPASVTWAGVPVQFLDGVERYLADRYGPLVGEAFPAVAPIQVNLAE